MNIKISEMTEATSLGANDLIPIVQSGVSKSIKAKNTNIYSTSNEEVIGKWNNGKPLYRKIFEGNIPTTSTMGTVATGFIYLPEEVEYAFVESAYIDRTSDANVPQINPLPVVSWGSNALVRTMCNIVFYNATGMTTGKTKAVRIYNSDSGLSATTKIVAIVCYTKSTDTTS